MSSKGWARRSSRLGRSGQLCEAERYRLGRPSIACRLGRREAARADRDVFLAILELVWLAWFLIEPLPNANNAGLPGGVAMRRGLARAQGVSRSRAGDDVSRVASRKCNQELSHVENLPERLPILATALLIAAAARRPGRPDPLALAAA